MPVVRNNPYGRNKKKPVAYIDQLLSENTRLKEQIRTSYTPNPSPASTADTAAPPPPESYPSLQNPLFGERAWFYPYDSNAPPIYMGDAACTAFATRLRQFLTEDPNTAHVARTQYTPESSLLEGESQWPSLAQARLLVKIAFNQLSRVYHLFLRKSTLEQLESLYHLPSLRDDPALTCKFFSLFALVGSAMRLGLFLGLNHNIPARQCADPTEREHRVRLWWAIYIFDRMYTSKIGLPLQIRDDDIYVDLPAAVTSPDAEEQFSDTAYLVSSIRLARIVGQIVEKIYTRKPHQESFLQREQQLLLALQEWVQSLPAHIKLPAVEPPQKHVVSLHLQFNQPVITLSEACIHAARHSHTLIIEEWVNGSLPMYGYFYAQYLFSSAIILVMSGLLPSIGTTADLEFLETAIEILRRMKDHGNLAAAEFYENLKRVKQCLPSGSGNNAIPRSYTPEQSRLSVGDAAANVDQILDPTTVPVAGLTTEMAFLEPTMQDFLGRPNNEMDLINPGMFSIEDSTGIDAWPTTFWTS
ncbi:hypothetical protein APSETT444_008854 [Aspergillus pseudonomiae]